MADQKAGIALRRLEDDFSVCQVADYGKVDLNARWVFTGATDEERSLVCPTGLVPADAIRREDGWKGFGIRGMLDFSLVGILAGISAVLAAEKIGIFAVSTYNTDYVFVKAADFERALAALREAGYHVE